MALTPIFKLPVKVKPVEGSVQGPKKEGPGEKITARESAVKPITPKPLGELSKPVYKDPRVAAKMAEWESGDRERAPKLGHIGYSEYMESVSSGGLKPARNF